MKERLASRVVDPRGHLVASDTRLRLVRAGIAAAWCAPWSPLRMRVAQSLGFLTPDDELRGCHETTCNRDRSVATRIRVRIARLQPSRQSLWFSDGAGTPNQH